jgi:cation-transporting ATPase 13A3/4/5
MSVIVKRLRSASMEIYVKGAPEVMADICDKDSCVCAFSLCGGSEAELVTAISPR